MRIFLTLLILIFNFQSMTVADDIRDFEIAGFSIGDSLLDHFSKKKIEKEKFFEAEQGNNKEVARFYIREKKDNYDWITMSFKLTEVFDEKIYNWILDIFRGPLSIPSGNESYRNLILLNDKDDNSEKILIGLMIRYQFDLTKYILMKEISSFFETFSNGVSKKDE